MKDDDPPGCPRTAVTDDNIEKVGDMIQKDRRLGVRAVAEEVNLDRESVRRILREELNMRKVCAKMVPKVLSDEQKECCKELCLDLLQRIENEPDLLNLIIVMKLGYLCMIRKPSDNQCGGSQHHLQDKKKKHA